MNYTDLKNHIIAHTDRTDIGGVIDTFIEQAVSEINADVRHSVMVVRASTDISAQFTELPERVIELINVQNNTTNGAPLAKVSLDAADQVRADWMGVTDEPKYYTTVRGDLELIPVPDKSYNIGITYYQKVPVPSTTNPTNDLMTAFPQLFIDGALKYAYDYLKESDTYVAKSQVFEVEKKKVSRAHEAEKYGDGALHVRRRTYG